MRRLCQANRPLLQGAPFSAPGKAAAAAVMAVPESLLLQSADALLDVISDIKARELVRLSSLWLCFRRLCFRAAPSQRFPGGQ